MLLVAKAAIVAALGVLITLAGDPIVRGVFHLVGGTPTSTPDVMAPEESRIERAGQTLRAGRAIGWLERLATYACILAAFPTGIAAIVAVKGLARYPDLKSSDGTAERFIIGTFTSLLVAAAGAGLTHWLVGIL